MKRFKDKHESALAKPSGLRLVPAWFYGFLAVAIPLVAIDPLAPTVYVFVGIICLYFLYSYLDRPDRTLLLFIVLLPAVNIVPSLFRLAPGVNFDTIVIPALVTAALMCHSTQPRPPTPNVFSPPVVFLASLLIVSAIISVLTGSAQSHSWARGWYALDAYEVLSRCKNEVFFMFLGPLAFRLLWTPEHIRAASRLIAWSTIAVGAETISSTWSLIVSGEAGGAFRSTTMAYKEPNTLGGFLGLMLCVLLPLVLEKELPKKERIFYAFAVGLAGAGLIFSFSRGAWAGVMLGLVYIALAKGRRAIVLLLLLALTSSWWLPQSAFDRFHYTFRESTTPLEEGVELEGSAQSRVHQWKLTPGLWAQAPLIGHGYLSFPGKYGVITNSGGARSAHSSIIRAVVEHGVLGLAAYTWAIWMLLWGARRVLKTSSDPFLSALATGMIAAVVCLVILDLSGNRFFGNRVMPYIWILGGGLARMACEVASPRSSTA